MRLFFANRYRIRTAHFQDAPFRLFPALPHTQQLAQAGLSRAFMRYIALVMRVTESGIGLRRVRVSTYAGRAFRKSPQNSNPYPLLRIYKIKLGHPFWNLFEMSKNHLKQSIHVRWNRYCSYTPTYIGIKYTNSKQALRSNRCIRFRSRE